MPTITEARDAINGVINTGWLASAVTMALPMLWDDVKGDKPGHDANGLPIAYGRTTVRHLQSNEETLGGEGVGTDLHEGQVIVQVFAPKGDGYTRADAIAQVVKGFFQRKRFTGGGWFYDVTASEAPSTGPWDQINVRASFRYPERIG